MAANHRSRSRRARRCSTSAVRQGACPGGRTAPFQGSVETRRVRTRWHVPKVIQRFRLSPATGNRQPATGNRQPKAVTSQRAVAANPGHQALHRHPRPLLSSGRSIVPLQPPMLASRARVLSAVGHRSVMTCVEYHLRPGRRLEACWKPEIYPLTPACDCCRGHLRIAGGCLSRGRGVRDRRDPARRWRRSLRARVEHLKQGAPLKPLGPGDVLWRRRQGLY
jgi:hypothetical protein